MSRKSFIDSVEVKSPCTEDWDKMHGNDRVRFCDHCAKDVNNLSEMTRKQAMRLVLASDGNLCIRYNADPITSQPMFADQLLQITRRAPRLTAGVMSASLSLSTLAYAQTETLPSTPIVNTYVVSTVENDTEESEETEADEPTVGSVEGFIWDTSGTGVPEVSLTLVNSDSGDVEYETTDDRGFYRFEDIEPGTYVLRVETSTGSIKKVAPGIEISEGQRVVHNLHVTVVSAEEGEGRGYGSGWGGAIAMVPYSLPLSQAVAKDDVESVRRLLANGASPNDRDANYDDITPFFLAVENGNIEVAKLLIDHGADVNATDKTHRTPLMFLDDDATVELIDLLLRAGAGIRAIDDNKNTVLHSALRSINVDVLKALIAAGADINATDEEGETLLIKAAGENDLVRVKALLDAGVDVNVRDNRGESAWDATSNIQIEKLLLQHGAVADYGTVTVTAPERSTDASDETEDNPED